MKYFVVTAMVLIMASCATTPQRAPSAANDLTGTYLGEGIFRARQVESRQNELRRPAMRMYLDRAQGEADTYYGVLVEYDQMITMALPYLASQKAPSVNKVIGYLDKIATRISAYKLVPGSAAGTYDMHNLEVRGNRILPAATTAMVLRLNPNRADANSLDGAVIDGNKDGQIVFPGPSDKWNKGFFGLIGDVLTLSQYELATITYKMGKLGSSWRGNWKDLEGSYLSEYGRFTDGVLELYSENSRPKSKFIKTNTTTARNFTNPKSAAIEGDYEVSEPIPKMYLLTPTARARTASDVEMTARIGLFLDVFDGSAPEAGGHMVTELAYTNPQDPEDFMMYYQHPKHLKNVGVEPRK